MLRRLLLPALALAALSVSGAAASAAVPVRQTGVVLSVLSEKHSLRLVEGPRVVDVLYHGAVPTGVAPGARITFTQPGKHATHIVVAGHTDHVSVPGFVVRSGKSLELRLADGSSLALTKTSRLKVGQLAHVLVRFSANGTTATPVQPTTPGTKPTSPGTPTTPSTSHCANAACTFDLIGSVQSIDNAGDLTIIPVSGAASFVVDPGQVSTDDVYVGDFVHIVGTQSATTGTYTLTSLDEVVGCDNVSCTLMLDGTVDEVDVNSIIVDDQNGDEYQISATAAQLAGPPVIQAGDAVHIVGTEDPTTGNYTATTIKDSGPAPGGNGSGSGN